jgi:hypothetical protein
MHGGVEVSLAQSLVEEARMINREMGNQVWELENVTILTLGCRLQGNSTVARVLAEEGLARSRSLKYRRLEASFLGLLAAVARDRSDVGAAQTLYAESLAIYRELGLPLWQANKMSELAALAIIRGDASSAGSHLTEALDIYRKIGERGLELAPSFDVIGALASQAQQYIEAARFSGVADTLRGSALPSDPFHREHVVLYRAQGRETLGDAAYDTAYKAGCALKRETAINEALAWLASAH